MLALIPLLQVVALGGAAALPAPAIDACQLITGPGVVAIVGSGLHPEAEAGSEPTCTGFDKATKKYLSVIVTTNETAKLRRGIKDAADYFASSKAEWSSDPARAFVAISGIGDDAYRASMDELVFVRVLKSERVVQIMISGFSDTEIVAIAKAVADQI